MHFLAVCSCEFYDTFFRYTSAHITCLCIFILSRESFYSITGLNSVPHLRALCTLKWNYVHEPFTKIFFKYNIYSNNLYTLYNLFYQRFYIFKHIFWSFYNIFMWDFQLISIFVFSSSKNHAFQFLHTIMLAHNISKDLLAYAQLLRYLSKPSPQI